MLNPYKYIYVCDYSEESIRTVPMLRWRNSTFAVGKRVSIFRRNWLLEMNDFHPQNFKVLLFIFRK
jgi:hypothetical protein